MYPFTPPPEVVDQPGCDVFGKLTISSGGGVFLVSTGPPSEWVSFYLEFHFHAHI